MNLKLVEKWEVYFNHYDNTTSLYKTYDDENEAAEITDIINYDCTIDFQGKESVCFRDIKNASLFRVRHYAIK